MYGAVFGDIMGSWYEWHNRKSEDIELFPREARFTDDTVMTMAVALALVAAKDDWTKLPGFVDTAMHELGTRYPDAGYGERFGMWML